MLEYGGPIAKAIGLMMAGRPDWIGTSEELWTALADVDDDFFATKEEWFVRPEIFTAALKELEPKLADADLSIAWLDDGRILIGRMSREGSEKRRDAPPSALVPRAIKVVVSREISSEVVPGTVSGKFIVTMFGVPL